MCVYVFGYGPGIPRWTAVYFELSRAADSNAGSGLGLTISRRLLQQMGADLYLDSVVGEGVAFGLSYLCNDLTTRTASLGRTEGRYTTIGETSLNLRPLDPSQVRYQTAPLPKVSVFIGLGVRGQPRSGSISSRNAWIQDGVPDALQCLTNLFVRGSGRAMIIVQYTPRTGNGVPHREEVLKTRQVLLRYSVGGT